MKLLPHVLALAILAAVAGAPSLSALALGVGLIALYVWRLPATALDRVTVSRRHPRRLFHGEEGRVELSIENRGWLPLPWISLYESVPLDLGSPGQRWVTSLGPGETRRSHYRLRGHRRGHYRLGPSVLTTSDLFGWRPAQRRGAEASELVVYPRILPLDRLGLPAGSPVTRLSSRIHLFSDPHRVVGSRPYRSGDPVRSIHWKHTASEGAPMVRQTQPGVGRDTVIYLDLARPSYPGRGRRAAVERAVTVAASVAYHIVTVERQAVGLRVTAADQRQTVQVELAPRGDAAHLVQILEALARVQPLDHTPDLTAEGLPFGATVLVVTGRLDGGIAAALLNLRRAGLSPAVVAVTEADPVWQERLPRKGIPVWQVTSDRSLTFS